MMSFARLLAQQGAKGLSQVAPKVLSKVITQPPLNQTVGKLLTQPPMGNKAQVALHAATARKLAQAMTRTNVGAGFDNPFGTGLKRGASEAFKAHPVTNQLQLPFEVAKAAPAMTTPARKASNEATKNAIGRRLLREGAGRADATKSYGKDPISEMGFSHPFRPAEPTFPPPVSKAEAFARRGEGAARNEDLFASRGPMGKSVSGQIPESSFPSDPTIGARPYPGPQGSPARKMAATQRIAGMRLPDQPSPLQKRIMSVGPNGYMEDNLQRTEMQNAIQRRLAEQRTNPAAVQQIQAQRGNRLTDPAYRADVKDWGERVVAAGGLKAIVKAGPTHPLYAEFKRRMAGR